MKQKILIVFGTRPEAIKMAPVIRALRARPDAFDTRVCVTAQHRQMLDQVLNLFQIQPDFDLDLMRQGQDLTEITTHVLLGMRNLLQAERPAWVIVQGDTTTTFTTSLAAFYEKIKVGHVEAGLRTSTKYAPWPEEINRHLTGVIADIHFAPTEHAKANLLSEGVPESSIHVTGNTVVDALLQTIDKLQTDQAAARDAAARFSFLDDSKRLILVTGHRRESFGPKFESICLALYQIVANHPDVELVYPVHLNPNVQEPVKRILHEGRSGSEGRIHLIEPVEYLSFVYLMQRAYLIVTDSGGVQEEAPTLKKPILVMRDTTERPEVVTAGVAKLVGTNRNAIVKTAARLLTDPQAYQSMSGGANPYGDGKAAERIVAILEGNR